ncbi:MAG: DUF2268 domain-containing putative Zn-dependent protease [Anaerolineales bacterium]|nr:DUF2268 domain-containing putative Zn-dependent protease [Anaerolineales bacterium]
MIIDTIVGVDDFRQCKALLGKESKWEVWLEHYYSHYANVFDTFLKRLYLAELESWREHVEMLDFDAALKTAEKFLYEDGVKRTENLLATAERICPIDTNYVLYLLIGLGHVDGTAMVVNPSFLYVGLERYVSSEQLEYLVPHEYNHLVRMTTLYDIEDTQFQPTFGDFVIAEGLATFFSGWVHRIGMPSDLAQTLMMTGKNLEKCHEQREILFDQIFKRWNTPMTPTTYGEFAKYLFAAGSDSTTPERSGYYVGNQIICDLIARKHDIVNLTKIPTTTILELYQS